MAETAIWTRLEPLNRLPDRLDRSLSAQILDPLWMLTRQWQTGEHQGEDAGAPAKISLKYHMASLHYGSDPNVGADLSAGGAQLPEAALLGEGPPLDWGERARLGQELGYRLGLIGAAGELALDSLITRFSLNPDPAECTLPSERRSASLIGEDGLDGVALWRAITLVHNTSWLDAARAALPSLAGLPSAETCLTAIAAWAESVSSRYPTLASEAAAPGAWSSSQLRYQMSLSALHPDGRTKIRLNAHPEAAGGLDWQNLDVDGEDLGGAAVATARTLEVTPSRVSLRGMPAARWWDFEDSARALLAITAEPNDLAVMMWLEFVLLASHDWFIAPLPVKSGQLVWVESLVVTDIFGQRTTITPADQGARPAAAADLPAMGTQRWSLFRSTCVPRFNSGGNLEERFFQKAPKLSDFLVVPPGVGPLSLQGPRLEELRLARDEGANMVWGIEQTVQDRWGRPVAGSDLCAHRPGTGDDAPLPAVGNPSGASPLVYRARTPVPANWTPFVAQRLSGEQIRLRHAALWSEQGAARQTAGRLLEEIGESGELNEVAVTRGGVRVARELRRARAVDGSTVTWVQRLVESGAGEAGSGLRFDLALPDTNPTKDEGI